MAELDTPPPPTRRRYRKPSMRTFGGLVELTRMSVGKSGMADGGTIIGMRRTGI